MDIGFDFRGSSGYVTDPANCIYVLATDIFPQTRGPSGIQFGWVTVGPDGALDRDSGIDARLAGVHYLSPNQVGTFRVDLDAANSKDIRLALGDTGGSGAHGQQRLIIRDNMTELFRLEPAAITDGKWWDATGVERASAANWVSANAARTEVFASTIFFMDVGHATASEYNTIAHLRITDTGGGGPTAPVSKSRIISTAVRRASTY